MGHYYLDIQYMSMKFCEIDVVVNHVTNVAIEHGLLKKFWCLVKGCVIHTAGTSFLIWNYADPLTSLELISYYLTLAMSIHLK